MYKVSVLVPIYRVEKYIERCARSLFEQTYENLEYIFVDDCSPDDSIAILRNVVEEYPERKNQFRLIRNELNRGASASKNVAIENATGEFVCFVDADDWMEVNAIGLLVKEQLKTKADVIWGKALMHLDKGIVELEESYYTNKHEWVLCYCRLTTGLVMVNWRRIIRRSLFEQHGIRSVDGFNYSEDKLLMSQVAYYANSFSTIDDCIYHYNRQNSLSATAKQDEAFNTEIFRQESANIQFIERFFSDKEDVYYDEVGKARMRYLERYLDQAVRSSSREGFGLVVQQISTSNQRFLKEIGWHTWKRHLYGNYFYMKYFPKLKRKMKHFIKIKKK